MQRRAERNQKLLRMDDEKNGEARLGRRSQSRDRQPQNKSSAIHDETLRPKASKNFQILNPSVMTELQSMETKGHPTFKSSIGK